MHSPCLQQAVTQINFPATQATWRCELPARKPCRSCWVPGDKALAEPGFVSGTPESRAGFLLPSARDILGTAGGTGSEPSETSEMLKNLALAAPWRAQPELPGGSLRVCSPGLQRAIVGWGVPVWGGSLSPGTANKEQMKMNAGLVWMKQQISVLCLTAASPGPSARHSEGLPADKKEELFTAAPAPEFQTIIFKLFLVAGSLQFSLFNHEQMHIGPVSCKPGCQVGE